MLDVDFRDCQNYFSAAVSFVAAVSVLNAPVCYAGALVSLGTQHLPFDDIWVETEVIFGDPIEGSHFYI
jgi:hypothetical protein